MRVSPWPVVLCLLASCAMTAASEVEKNKALIVEFAVRLDEGLSGFPAQGDCQGSDRNPTNLRSGENATSMRWREAA